MLIRICELKSAWTQSILTGVSNDFDEGRNSKTTSQLSQVLAGSVASLYSVGESDDHL
jgi:hypothetical protein